MDQEDQDLQQHVARDGSSWTEIGNNIPIMSSSAENIVHVSPGPAVASKRKVKCELSSFLQILDESVFRKLHKHTVAHANAANDHEFFVTLEDIYAFVGLLYARGVFVAKNEPLHSLWSLEYGRNFFRSTMPRNKFQFIMKHLRFDDQSTRAERRTYDKFCPIRDIWIRLIENSQAAYNPTFHLTVDEQLFPMKSRCPFIQFIPTKPDKYGVKFWILCDAEKRYIFNGYPYLGKVETEDRNGVQLGEFVTMKLLEPYYKGGYSVSTDYFFTSLKLSNRLLAKNITLVGTMKRNRREIPSILQHSRSTTVGSVIGVKHVSSKTCLFSYKAKKEKTVIMLSLLHTNIQMSDYKPEVIHFYNQTKYRVDTVDQMARKYSTKSSSRRWPFQVFCNILDLSAINAHTLYRDVTNSIESRRNFLISLSKKLTSFVRNVTCDMPIPRNPSQTPPSLKRVKCKICRKNCTRSSCSRCNRFVCGTCTVVVCTNCDC